MARFDSGWVRIDRRAALGDINSNFVRGGLFMALVGMANIQESIVSWKGRPRKLERGEIATSLHELAEMGGVDVKTISRHLNYLVLRETVSIEKSATGTIIKLINYRKYQDVDAEGSTPSPHDRDDHRENDVHTIGIHIEQRNKETKKQEYNSAHPLWSFYEKLCSEYPIKVSCNADGFKRFLQHVKTEADFPKVMTHLGHYKTHLQRNAWKQPKQSIETWFGTKKSGFFWLQWESPDVGENTLHASTEEDWEYLRKKYGQQEPA